MSPPTLARRAFGVRFSIQILAYSLFSLHFAPAAQAGPTLSKICKALSCFSTSDDAPPANLPASASITCPNANAPKTSSGWNINKAQDMPTVQDIVADLKLCGIITAEGVTTVFYSFNGGLTNAKRFQQANPSFKAKQINEVLPESWYTALDKFNMGTAQSAAQQAFIARTSQALATVSKGNVYLVADPSANIYTIPMTPPEPDQRWKGPHNVWYDYEFATLQDNTAVTAIYTVNSGNLSIDKSETGSWVRDRDSKDAPGIDANTVTKESIQAKMNACPATGNAKRGSTGSVSACSAGSSTSTTSGSSSTSAPSPSITNFSCSMQEPDPDAGKSVGLCVCKDSTTTISAPLISIPSSKLTIYSQSCEYSTWPASTTTMSNDLGGPTTNSKLCQICTPYALNEDNCHKIPEPTCFPQVAAANVTVGSTPVHVGTLTSKSLYTSVSNALESLCPTVSQTTSAIQCDETGTAHIDGVPYVDSDSLATGELVVKVLTSEYNSSQIRTAMINSVATSIEKSASGNNCYTADYVVEELKRGLSARDLYHSALGYFGLGQSDLIRRDHPYPVSESETMCNAAGFFSVNYYNQYWRSAPEPGPTDFMDVEVSFESSESSDFVCEFLDLLLDGLAIVEPEFVVEDLELEEGINALCCEGDDCQGGST